MFCTVSYHAMLCYLQESLALEESRPQIGNEYNMPSVNVRLTAPMHVDIHWLLDRAPLDSRQSGTPKHPHAQLTGLEIRLFLS